MDLVGARVLYVAEDRKQSSLDGFWGMLTAAQIGSIEAVAMDMWDPYIALVRVHVPEADGKIVFDKFHVASIWDMPWTWYGGRKTKSRAPPGMTVWQGRATTG